MPFEAISGGASYSMPMTSAGMPGNAALPPGQSCHCSSVKNGRLAETKKYIEKDHMSPEMPNACGWTLLQFAAYYESAPLVEYLISRSVKVDAKTLTHSGQCIPYSKIPAGSTPLCIAAYYGQADIIDILLKHGAKPGLKNSEGYSALDYAKKFEFALSFKTLVTAADKAASASGDGAESDCRGMAELCRD